MAADPRTDHDLDEMEHRLDEVEEEIEHARKDAKDHRTIPGKHEPTFIDPDG